MEVRCETIDGVLVVRFSGSWDGKARENLEAREELQGPQQNMVFDFSQVGYIDSAGLGVLVHYAKSIKSNGHRLRLCCVSPLVERVMKMVHVDRIVPLDGSAEESLKQIKTSIGQ